MKDAEAHNSWFSFRHRAGFIPLVYLLIHVAAVGLSFFFSINPENREEVAVFWPAAGVLVSALLLSRRAIWPALLFVSVVAQIVADFLWAGRTDIGISILFGVANALEALIVAYLLQRFVGEKLTFTKLRDVFGLALYASVGAIFGATLGAAGLGYLELSSSYWSSWQLWWASDTLGILIVTPLIFTWVHWPGGTLRRRKFPRIFEAGMLYAGLFLLLWLIFGRRATTIHTFLDIPYATLPFLMWAAVRFRPHIATATYLIVVVSAVLLTNQGSGPFLLPGQPTLQNVLFLQLFLAVNTLSSLALTAVFAELHQTKRELEQFSQAEGAARQQAETLRAANLALSESLNLATVLEILLQHLSQLIPYDTAAVMLADGDDSLQIVAARGHEQLPQVKLGPLPFKIKTPTLVKQLLHTQQSLLIDDTEKQPDWEARTSSSYVRNWLGIPLVAQGQTIGLYSLTKLEPAFFTQEHQRLAETLAAQAATAVTNARLYQQVETNVQELEKRVQARTAELEWQYRRQAALAEVELSINQPHERQFVLNRIVQTVTELLPATGGASIILWDASKDTFSVSESTVSGQPAQMGAQRARSRGASHWIVQQRQPLVVPDIQDNPFGNNPMLSEYGIKAYVGVPLLDGAQALGVLYALDKEPRQYKEDDLSFLTAVAHRAAMAIVKVQLYEQSVQRAAELKVLYELGKEISAQLNLDAVLQTIASNALHLTGADKSLIILAQPDKAKLVRVVGEGYTDEELAGYTFAEFEQGISSWVMQKNQPTLVDDIVLDERNAGMALDKARRSKDKAAAIAPLQVENRAVGTLTIVNGRNKRAFSQNDLNLTVLLAGQAAIAIRNAQLYQAAQEADRLKSAFLASMSHELRTPLNSIIGFSGIIAQELAGPLNDEQKKQMSMVRLSAHHLLNLINDVLDISKIEAGQLQVAYEPCNMPEIITRVLSLLKPQADKKGLALTAVISPQVGEILSDARRVEQILINLVNNGIKFTSDGSVQIRCQLQQRWLLTEVIDTGMGIKNEDMVRLFQPFQQIESGLNRMHEGTGLGLSICQRLVELLGGEITVQSVWGVGSTFAFTLPLRT